MATPRSQASAKIILILPTDGTYGGGASLDTSYGVRLTMPDATYSYFYFVLPKIENYIAANIFMRIWYHPMTTVSYGSDDVYWRGYIRPHTYGNALSAAGLTYDYYVDYIYGVGSYELTHATLSWTQAEHEFDTADGWEMRVTRQGSSSTDSYDNDIGIKRIDIIYDGYWLNQ